MNRSRSNIFYCEANQARRAGMGLFVLCGNPSVIFLTARGTDTGLLPAFFLLLCSCSHSLHNSLLPVSFPSHVLAWGSICLGAAEAPLLRRPVVTPQEWDSVQSALAYLDQQNIGAAGREQAGPRLHLFLHHRSWNSLVRDQVWESQEPIQFCIEFSSKSYFCELPLGKVSSFHILKR